MAGPAGANAPPIGVVIKEDDGSHSIWNGKQWLPATQGANGGWGVDSGKMAAMGLGGAAGPLSPTDQKQVADMQTNAGQMETLAGNTNDFMRKNQETPTGGVLAIPFASRIAKAIGLDPTGNLADMDRDNIASASQMRSPGMRMTQMEFGKFLGATPSVQNDGPQNATVAAQISNGNALAQAKASFFSTYLNTKRSLDGAIPAWLAFKAQHFDASGNYSHDPLTNQQAANSALKARSAQSKAPTILEPSDYLQ